MLKPLTETLEVVETVEDVINVLLQLPKDYLLHPLGQKCQMGVDHIHECVYMDDPNCIGEFTFDVLEEAKQNGEPTEVEVSDEKLETYKPNVYVVIGLQRYGTKVVLGTFKTEAQANEYGDHAINAKEVVDYRVELFNLE